MPGLNASKKLFLKVLLICFLSFLPTFKSEAANLLDDKTPTLTTNNLSNSGRSAIFTHSDVEKGSILVKSEKGVKRIPLEYIPDSMNHDSNNSSGSSAVELNYNTRASVRNVNYLLDSETAHTFEKAMLKRDSLLIGHNKLLEIQANLLLSQVNLKLNARKEKEIQRELEAKAHLVWVGLFILSSILFWLGIRIDDERLQYISLRTGVIGLLGTLYYSSSLMWLFIN